MDKIEEIAREDLVARLRRVEDAPLAEWARQTVHDAADALAAYEVMTRSDGVADHLRHILGVVRPYISDKAGVGIIGAVDAALTQSSVQPERDHE